MKPKTRNSLWRSRPARFFLELEIKAQEFQAKPGDLTSENDSIESNFADFNESFFALKDQDSKTATIAILAKIGELEIQIPGFDTNACNGHLECPLKKGQEYTLHYSMTIPAIAPTVSHK